MESMVIRCKSLSILFSFYTRIHFDSTSNSHWIIADSICWINFRIVTNEFMGSFSHVHLTRISVNFILTSYWIYKFISNQCRFYVKWKCVLMPFWVIRGLVLILYKFDFKIMFVLYRFNVIGHSLNANRGSFNVNVIHIDQIEWMHSLLIPLNHMDGINQYW